MVIFQDFYFSQRNYLCIAKDESDLEKNGTRLLIHKPLTGLFADPWPTLDGFPHLSTWTEKDNMSRVFLRSSLHKVQPSQSHLFSTLGRRIILGKAHWGSTLKINGEFSFIPNYWEWLEDVLSHNHTVLEKAGIYYAVYASLFTYDRNSDIFRAFCEAWCPETNSLHTSVGELSISLWDLHVLGGLPLFGKFYDEIIPCTAELTGKDETDMRFIPKSCEYLFVAFHSILTKEGKKNTVSVDDWIAFWYKGESIYKRPPPRKAKKSVRPKATYNPTGEIDQPKVRLEEAKAAFMDLGIEDDLFEETYLAALLSCWLCTFALPNEDDNIIRPATFKIASMMASGEEICLAVPVLTSIYKGLNKIASSSTPGRSGCHLPAHYIYAWLAHYFYTHYAIPNTLFGPRMTDYSGEGGAKYFNESEARTLIHRGDVVLWNSLAPFKNRDQLFIDGEVVEHPSQLAYFLNIRSNRLVLRCGDSFFVEPYSPHRFSRQFGYCQYIPKDLQHDERSTTSDMALRYWRTCIRYKTGSRALFPSSPPSFRRHITSSFSEWWKKVHGDYLIKGRDFLIKSTQPDPSKAKGAKRVKGNERDKLQLPPKTMKDTSTRVPVLESMKKKHEELHSSTKHVEDTSTGRLAVEGMGKAREKLLSPTRQVEDTSTRRLTVEGEGKEREKLSSPTQQVEDTSTRRLAVEGEGKEREKLSSPTQQVEDTSTRRLAVNQVETFARSRPRIVIKYPTKATPVNDGNNKRSISQDVEESSTSQEERHWKRSKKARTPYFDDLGIGDKFFDGVSTPLVPLEDIGRGLQLDDFEMPDVELIPEGSGDSVDGPDSFDLHARRSEDKLPPMKAHPTASVVSTFRGEDLISDCQRVYLSSLWSGLSHKIAKHRLELLNSVEEEAEKVLKEMDRINAIDIMPLKGLLAKFFQDIGLYNAVRSSSAEKMSRERQEDLLAQTNSRLSDIEGKKNQKAKHVQSIDSTLADMDSEEAQLKIEEAQLKTRFHDLHVRREEAKSLRLREEEELLQIQEDASRLKEEVSTIKNAAIQSDEDTQNLERMKDLLEANRRELIDFKLFS